MSKYRLTGKKYFGSNKPVSIFFKKKKHKISKFNALRKSLREAIWIKELSSFKT